MVHAIRIPRRWQIRLAGTVLLLIALCNMRLLPCAIVLLLTLLPVLASPTSAHVDDQDNGDQDHNVDEHAMQSKQQLVTPHSHQAPDT